MRNHSCPTCLILKTTILFAFFLFRAQAQEVRIIPQPMSMQQQAGFFLLSSNARIFSESEAAVKTAEILQSEIVKRYGFNLEINLSAKKDKNAEIRFLEKSELPREGYELQITDKAITLNASDASGWFYGVQSLLQMLPEAATNNTAQVAIPKVTIQDAPRFPWRAFMLDEGRYFKGMEQVKMLLDEMAYLKMNTFHWHLTDDQGWRIEIKKYPKLTEIGSKRKSTQIGPLKWQSPMQSGEPHEGYYTQDEIREIVVYAKERHITIVPEIEMPGHSTAAIAAYPWLGTNKEEIEVPIIFGVGKDVYDVSDNRVILFLTDVLDEVMELFPSEIIHIGGDEVKYDHWKASEKVMQYMQANGLQSPADLQIHFTNHISQYIQSKGRRMMGWNEIMGHNLHEYQDESDTQSNQELAANTVVHFWKGDIALANRAVQSGYQIVNSLHSSTYLDYDYKTIPLSMAYDFDPIPDGLTSEYHSMVLGSGCQMWGEWIPTNGEMHFMAFPRIAAYAEVGWTPLEQKNYGSFKLGLKQLEKRWAMCEIYYAPRNY